MSKYLVVLGLYFAVAICALSGQTPDPVVRFATNLGNIDVQLSPADAPLNVANFLSYVDAGSYNGSFIHRSDPGFVIQGGGYIFVNGGVESIPTQAPVANEFKLPNVRGTIAMARIADDPNSATDQWFFNLTDNSATLDTEGGGFTVFGHIVDTNGLAVMDAIAALQVIDASGEDGTAFTELPVIDYTYTSGNAITASNLVEVQSITRLPSPPTYFGSVQLSVAAVTVAESAGSVTLSVNRVLGSTGAISVNYATADSSASAGVDYQSVSGTLTWADGDTTAKTITVPIINRNLTSGSTLFLVNLSTPAGGAALGAPAQEAVTIIETDTTAANIQSVTLLSPPTDITIFQNQPVLLYADVEAVTGTLQNAEFHVIDSSGNSTDLGGFTSQRGGIVWEPTAVGNFTLEVVATDIDGNSAQATIPITVAAAAVGDVTPLASLYGGLNGVTVAMNDRVTVFAQAVDSAGNALQNVQFYLDNVPVASSPVTAIRKADLKAADASAGTLFVANVVASKIQQLLTVVGTNAKGVSSVSTAATIYGKANAGSPPTATISNLASGASVPAGTPGQSVNVSATSGSQPIAQVQLVVDNQSIGTATAAPYTFSLPSLATGSHVLSIIATDISALSSVSTPIVVTAQQASTSTPAFFTGEMALSNGVYYLAFANGNYFGYYSFLPNPAYIFHFDLGYEYVFDANDGHDGIYLYDFASNTFFYTSPTFPFPYLYDFTLNAVLYYFPDTTSAGHYTTNPRYFVNLTTGAIFTK